MTSIVKNAEQQYKDIIENLSDPLHVINDKFEIILMNRAMKNWLLKLGINTNLIGSTIFEVFPFLPQKIHDDYDYVLREGKSLFTEEDRSIFNKEMKAEIRKIPIIKDGKVNQIITTIRDITKRKKAEQKLEESEELFRTIAEKSSLGIGILQDNMAKYVNKRYADLVGYEVEDIISWKPGEFIKTIYPKDKNKVLRHAELRQKGLKDNINHYIYRGLKKSGEIAWFEVFANTIMYKGRPADLAISLDITEQIKGQEKLKESEHKLRERVKELSCLFNTSKILVEPNISIEEILQKTVELLPSALQFPDKACARIIYSDKEYLTPNFQESKWKLSSYETIRDELLKLEVYYLEEKEFLEEEIYLFNDVCNRLKNILDQKEAEIRVKKSEENYRDLYEEAPIACFSIGTDQAILKSNKAVERLLGYTKDEFLNLKVFDLYFDSKYGIEKAKNLFKQFLNGEPIKDIELQMKKKNGDPIWISLSVKPIFDLKGNVIESRSMVLDITDRKIAEEALILSEKKYKEAFDRGNFYKDLFAHDISNILQVVNSSAELISFHLGESDKSKDIKNISEIIIKQVERGSKLVSNVRTLSDLEEKEISTRNTEVCELLKKSIEYVKRTYNSREINILVDSIDKEYNIKANELLQDVFENILINGIKYNDHSKVDILIKITRQKIMDTKYLKMEFTDNGIGILDERKKIIFTSGNRELKGSKGMGLGLSLVRKILSIFNGKIQVEDRVKGDHTKGSNFVILLPE